jgi:hypothetical protein
MSLGKNGWKRLRNAISARLCPQWSISRYELGEIATAIDIVTLLDNAPNGNYT